MSYSDARPTESIHNLLTGLFQTQKAEEMRLYPVGTGRPELLDQFCTMTSELDRAGHFDNGYYSIAHLDLSMLTTPIQPGLLFRPSLTGTVPSSIPCL